MKATSSGLAGLGFENILMISRWAKKDIVAELGALRSFPWTIYHRQNWTKAGYNRHCASFYEVLRHQVSALPTLPAIVVFPSCDQVQLECLARLIGEFGRDWNPFVVAWVNFPPKRTASLDDPSSLAQHEEYKGAFRNLDFAKRNDDGIFLACETGSIRQIYTELSGHPVELQDPPKVLPKTSTSRAQKSEGDAIHLVVMGHANASKGYGLLPEALRQLLRRHPNLRATIHGDISGVNDQGMALVMDSIGQLGPHVTVLTEVLDSEHYSELLNSADLVILPYDPYVYRNRGSGIFTEASILGIPMVVPMSCDFIAESISEGRAVGFDRFDADSLSDAISRAVVEQSQLKANAVTYAARLGEQKNVFDLIEERLVTRRIVDVANTRQETGLRLFSRFRCFLAAVACIARM
jgi:glycosyltransferase involved in cell wall biosynthesis